MKYTNKTIEYGLYLLVFLLPIQTRWIIKAGELNGGYWEYGTLSLYGTDILLAAILVMFSFYHYKKKKLEIGNWKFGDGNKTDQITNYKLQISRVWWLIAGLELVIFISIFIASDKLVATYCYLRFLLGVGIFWLLISANYNKLRLLYAFLAGVLLQAGLGIYQFLSQSSFATKWLGMASHNPADLGVSVVETINGTRWLRAYGGLDHPNILGGLLVIGILLIAGLIIQIEGNKHEKLEIGNWKLGKSLSKLQITNFKLPLLLSVICFLLSAIFFTFSRGAWVGLIAGLSVILFIAILKKDLRSQKKLLQIILVVSVMAFVLFNIYSDLVLTRFSADARLEVKSNTERIESLQTARDLIKNNFLFGVGIGNYTNTVEKETLSGQPAWYYQPVHNFFLLVLAEIGIFGLILILLLIGYIMRESFKKGKYTKISLMLAILSMMLVDHWYWSLHFGVFLFWFVLGLNIKENKT